MGNLPRAIKIEKYIERKKVLMVYGARQVGKTTLVKSYLSNFKEPYLFITGDDLVLSEELAKCHLPVIAKILGNNKLIVIDEAQKINNIGRALKLMVDNFDISIIVTGSSSFDLANQTDEALTGRKKILTLYPIAVKELAGIFSEYEIQQLISEMLIYGLYPHIFAGKNLEIKRERVIEIMNSYLIKDIFEFQRLKRSNVIIQLLRLVAFQIGQQVSTTELSNQLNIDHKTVIRYLDLLEKSFVLFRLDGFSRNLRKEVTKQSKYYFYDLGVRNALIANFNQLNLRNDLGQLWENFIVMERVKNLSYKKIEANHYYWRNYQKKEIDLIEERGNYLYGIEIKYSGKKVKAPADWINAYPKSSFEVIHRENFYDFVV